jgi:hypothetical protein
MRSREGVMACEGLGLDKETLQKLTPIVPAWQSDSGSMDGLLELLTRCGRDVAEVGADSWQQLAYRHLLFGPLGWPPPGVKGALCCCWPGLIVLAPNPHLTPTQR